METDERRAAKAAPDLQGKLPGGLAELMRLPGLGPGRLRSLHEQLSIHDLEQLHRAIEDHRLDNLPGFGQRLARRLAEAILKAQTRPARTKLVHAHAVATAVLDWLRGDAATLSVAAVGSLRRSRGTVGDVDLLAASRRPAAVVDRLVACPLAQRVLRRGATRAIVAAPSGLRIDLRVVRPEVHGSALHYLTGSRAHTVAVRRRASARGLRLTEHGVFHGKRRVAGETEESVFAAVDLPFIPPELREDCGEIEAAERGALPRCVERADLRGDLHCRGNGRRRLVDLAEAAEGRGLAYLAIVAASRRPGATLSGDETRLSRALDAIDAVNRNRRSPRLLKGVEAAIGVDGKLDLPNRVLDRFDLVVASVQDGFGLSRQKQTDRVLRALDHPHIAVLAAPRLPAGQLRAPFDVDMERIVAALRARGALLALSADPERFDLLEAHCWLAKANGVRIALGSNAATPAGLDALDHGVGQARRGWLTAGDVANTFTLDALVAVLDAAMGRPRGWT